MILPMSFFDTKMFGDIMQRIGDHSRIEQFLTGQTLNTLFSLVNLLIFGVVLGMYSMTIFTIFMVGSILYGFWVLLFLKERRKLDFKMFDVSAKNQGSLVQLIQGMQEIKLANAEHLKRWEWERIQTKMFQFQTKGLALNQYQQAGAFFLNEGKNILITFFTGDENPNIEKLYHACEVANIMEFIEGLPLGFNTKIGSEGNGISQGQKQRLLIARAVYKEPDYLFFDEATNALDANNEKKILENLEEFFHGRTVIVVAHRLSTVKNADQIVVLHKGEIIEVGTHETLTVKRGEYFDLVKNQLELGN
jgi:ABC-type bacteriocin/lantibiotic exporter with double-glycine peptidase domain